MRNEKERKRTPWGTKRNQEEREKKPRATAWGTIRNGIKNEKRRHKERRGTKRNEKKHSVNCALYNFWTEVNIKGTLNKKSKEKLANSPECIILFDFHTHGLSLRTCRTGSGRHPIPWWRTHRREWVQVCIIQLYKGPWCINVKCLIAESNVLESSMF